MVWTPILPTIFYYIQVVAMNQKLALLCWSHNAIRRASDTKVYA